MRIALSVWGDRISPVFDAAGTLLIVDQDRGKEVSRAKVRITEPDPPARVRKLLETGAQILVCGAVSRELAALIESSRIAVIPWISGTTEEVLRAMYAGEFPQPRFLMPGCGRGPHRRRHRRGRRRSTE